MKEASNSTSLSAIVRQACRNERSRIERARKQRRLRRTEERWGGRNGKQGEKRMHEVAQVGSRKKGGIFSSPLHTPFLPSSSDVVVIYCGLSSPGGMAGKWALNWVSIHHLLTLMLVVLECLHLMFLFKINYLQSI